MTEQATEAVDNTQTTDNTQAVDTATESTEAVERTGTLAVDATEAIEQTWIDQLTDSELKGSKSLANFKDIDGLAKSYISLEKKLGAPKEDIEYKADDYGYELPEGYTPNEDILGAVKDKAFEIGVKPEDFKALVETFAGGESDLLNQMGQDRKDQAAQLQESLKEEWGNQYEERLEQADKTWQQFTSPEEDHILDNLQPDAKLAIAKLMDNISQKISSPSIGKLEGASLLTKEEASNKIQAIYNDKDHPFHRGDQAAIAEIFELNKVKVGEV